MRPFALSLIAGLVAGLPGNSGGNLGYGMGEGVGRDVDDLRRSLTLAADYLAPTGASQGPPPLHDMPF